jgi:type I restriction enzyme R subunit
MTKGRGRADYLISVDQLAVGVIEAKPQGSPPSGLGGRAGCMPRVARQGPAQDGGHGRPPSLRVRTSGAETHFTNGCDPNPRARRVFAFPQPSTLARTLRDATSNLNRPTWRGKVAAMPHLDIKMLRPAQITAIKGKSLPPTSQLGGVWTMVDKTSTGVVETNAPQADCTWSLAGVVMGCQVT